MNEQKEITATKTKKKGLGNYFGLFLIFPYASMLIALALLIIALLELLNITEDSFISGYVAFEFCITFTILAFVSRIYYKMFKRD